MKKIFISAGELSGDYIGAWYLKLQTNVVCEAIGGKFLKDAGAKIYDEINKLSVVGIVEIVRHLPFILKFLHKLTSYITDNKFDEVILIDFPGFNLMLAKRLKKLNSQIKITYLSPPQLWVWGAWRVKKIKKNCDRVIVLYPFEVDWYKAHGVNAEWLGYPFYQDLSKYFLLSEKKENRIAMLPGSRRSETISLFPYFAELIYLFKKDYPDVRFVLPVSESFSKDFIINLLEKYGIVDWEDYIEIIHDDPEKFKKLATCCLAISKPGTASLQIALMKVPTVIIYKTSWFTYLMARPFIRVQYMGIANLLLKKNINPEFIQNDCNSQKIYKESSRIYTEFLENNINYRLNGLGKLRELLKN